MLLSDFDFVLPPDRIARFPARPRDAARMMVLHRRTGQREDRTFSDIAGILNPSDVLVLNNTRVIRARMRGILKRRGGDSRAIEVFFAEPDGFDVGWRVLCRPGRRIRKGDRVTFGDGPSGTSGIFGETVHAAASGLRLLHLESAEPVEALLEREGEIPLPPYIERTAEPGDDSDYQTVYASAPGAIAAPTAGLHFTPRVLDAIRARGVEIVELTLHVGIGTFLPVRTEDPREHALHPERFELGARAAETLERARTSGRRIVAVGTTVARTLEYVVRHYGDFRAASGEADIFILPGFEFRAVNALVTNFHLPRSTLLMLVSAFAGREQILDAYRHAVESGYRFYSYGDCMMIAD